ncbi:hypothetical protein [Methylobacterium soli]|uniref:Uncharacterized protein n=1 Tax=Methylobacterium soli TaxID=553447 RepID=A0A6L3SVU9_9HYPH|nr:hypothetical protein [Methylobacterium soli]KAB1075909.1 hypothetical protein F6X53_24060 [Methylobacterium soli]GJE41848.1 hypothetical protein AEGHOMDF_1017 [Methylobacterium soli]
MAVKTKAKQKSSVDVQAELDRLDQERAAAISEHLALANMREAILLDGTDDEVRKHDEAMAAAMVRAERAALRRERLLPELDEAEAAEEQARRQQIYANAKAKRDDGVAALGEYTAAAEKLAKIARRIAAANFAVNEANRELPDGVEPLDTPEPYNGTPATGAEYSDEQIRVFVNKRTGEVVNGFNPKDPDIVEQWKKTGRRTLINLPSQGRPHRSFLHSLHIPGREPGEVLF